MKNRKIVWLIILLSIITSLILSYSILKNETTYENDTFSVNFDETWEVVSKTDKLILEQKKTKGKLCVQSKILGEEFSDIPLSNIISNIMDSIENQNKEYKLITREEKNLHYESYSYLYEYKNKEVVVNIQKDSNIIIVTYYEDDMENFDIVIDSVDYILDSIKINSSEKLG